jgi:hypothetical protein
MTVSILSKHDTFYHSLTLVTFALVAGFLLGLRMLVKEATAKPMIVPGPMGTTVPIDLNDYIPPWIKKWLLI